MYQNGAMYRRDLGTHVRTYVGILTHLLGDLLPCIAHSNALDSQ